MKRVYTYPRREIRRICSCNRRGDKKLNNAEWDGKKYKIHGHPSFCAALSMRGDFSIYNVLIPHWKSMLRRSPRRIRHPGKHTQKSLRIHGRAFDGIFMVMALYLRDDLALGCENYHYRFEYGIEILLLLLQPCILLELKNRMINDFFINLTHEEKFNMDVFNNPNLHPCKRIRFLKLLCFSWSFIRGFCVQLDEIKDENEEDKPNCIKLYQLISNMVNNFELFEKEWYLRNYNDLKDDLSKRKELHLQFCLVIQVLFGFKDILYQYRWGPRLCAHDNMFVKFRPKSKTELRHWYDERTKLESKAKLCEKFTHVELTIGKKIQNIVTFNRVVDPWLLFVKLLANGCLFDVRDH